MNIGNIYKKFCAVMILVGLILCNGRCAYAHSDELIKAIATSSENPTIEDLKYLVYLFEEDAECHQSRGEIIEANRAKALAVSIKAKIAIASKPYPIEEDYKEVIDLLQLETELWNNLGDNKSAAYSLMHMKQYKAKLGVLRIKNALLRAQINPTVNNWEILSKLNNEESILYDEAGDTKLSKSYLAESLRFKAIAAFFRAKENSTIKNWTETATLYGKAFSIYYSIGALSSASLCISEFVYAGNMVIQLGGSPIVPPTELVSLYFE